LEPPIITSFLNFEFLIFLGKISPVKKRLLGLSPLLSREKKALKKAFFCDLLSRQVKGLITNLSVFLYGAFSQLGNEKNLGRLIQIVFNKNFFWICHVLSLDTRAQQVAKIQHVSQIIFLLSFVNCKPKLANFSCGWLPVWLATSQNWKKEKKRVPNVKNNHISNRSYSWTKVGFVLLCSRLKQSDPKESWSNPSYSWTNSICWDANPAIKNCLIKYWQEGINRS